MVIKVCVIFATEVLFFSALLFGAAGTLRWPAAWAYLILFVAGAFLLTLWLARRDPALLCGWATLEGSATPVCLLTLTEISRGAPILAFFEKWPFELAPNSFLVDVKR